MLFKLNKKKKNNKYSRLIYSFKIHLKIKFYLHYFK